MKKRASVALVALLFMAGGYRARAQANVNETGTQELAQKHLDRIVSQLRQINQDEQQLAMAKEDLNRVFISGGSSVALQTIAIVAIAGAYQSFTGDIPARVLSFFSIARRKAATDAAVTAAGAAEAAAEGAASALSSGAGTPTPPEMGAGTPPDFSVDSTGQATGADAALSAAAKERAAHQNLEEVEAALQDEQAQAKKSWRQRLSGSGRSLKNLSYAALGTGIGATIVFSGADMVRVSNEIDRAQNMLQQEKSELRVLVNAAKF